MKKILFLTALLCVSMITFAEDVYDVNFALASQGSSATASTGTASLAIDGDNGTRWESAQTDDEWWSLDMGQARTFNSIGINWEGAYAKEYKLFYSTDGTNWSELYHETNLTKAGWQYIDVAKTTAQYIKYQGIQRATQWGQSFWEFEVKLVGASVLTTIELKAPAIAKIGEGVALTTVAKDQNNKEMTVDIAYEITPSDAGAVVNGQYMPAKIGNASIVAKSGEVASAAIEIFGHEGDNLALNNVLDQSAEYEGYGAARAVDGNDATDWQGSSTNGTAADEESRTFDCWFTVDLGGDYMIDLITIHFEGACSQEYHLDFSMDSTNWDLGYNYVGADGINNHTDLLSAQLSNNEKVRYVRFWSTKAATQWGMKIFEFQVFGRKYAKPEGIGPVTASDRKAVKILHNGKFYIMNGNAVYSITGQTFK